MITNILKKCFPFPPRDNQLDIACEIVNAFTDHKHVILNAPTGVGKSVIAMAVANYFNKTTSIVTSEKILQDQYTDDFNFSNIVSVKGVNAYTCPIDGKSASEAPCRLLGIKECNEYCDYHQMLLRRSRKIWITNYNIALTYPMFSKRQHFLIIADEMHKIESILLGNVTCTISIGFLDTLEKRLNLLNNNNNTSFSITNLYELFFKGKNKNDPDKIQFYYDIFQDFNYHLSFIIAEIDRILRNNYEDLKYKSYEGLSEDDHDRLKSMKYFSNTGVFITNFMHKFKILYEYINKITWIVELSEKEMVFKPVYANFLFNDIINPLSEKFLYMSATSYCKSMFTNEFAISNDEKVYEIAVDSPFPINNRKIYISNFASMSYDNIKESQQKMLGCIDDMLDNVQCRSVIHTGNYSIAQYISDHSRHTNRIVAPRSGQREIMIETMFKQKPNGILVSPSLIEGLSLNDDMCRVQIVVKVPYTSLADKRVKIRASQNPNWYSQEAIFKIVQSSGRGVRHKDDYCITFILDSSFDRLYNTHQQIFPFWFLKAIEYINVDEIIPTLNNFLQNHVEDKQIFEKKPNPLFDFELPF